jgi:hypothetical protein
MNSRTEYLLRYSGFPKFVNVEVEVYPQLSDFYKNPRPIKFVCSNLLTRKIARSVALSLATNYIEESKVKYPPYYIQKSIFIDICRAAYFKDNFEVLNKYKEGSLIIFEGLDEANSVQEMSYMSTFLSPMIINSSPLIFISSDKINEGFFIRFNSSSLGSLYLDLEEIVF